MSETLQLQQRLLLLILIVLLRHFQFCLAPYAHAILFTALLQGFLDARQLIVGIESLLSKHYRLLLHLNLLFAIPPLAVFPSVVLVVNGAEQFGIGQYEYRVACIEHCSVFGNDTLHESTFHGVHLYGHDRLHYALHIDILGEVIHSRCCQHLLSVRQFHLMRLKAHYGGIYHQCRQQSASDDVVQVSPVPRLFLYSDIHNSELFSKSYPVMLRRV